MDIDEENSVSGGDAMHVNANSIFGNIAGDHDPLSPSTVNNSTLSSASSRGRSKVWNEFVVAQDGKKVICRLCGDSLSYSNSHSTSSMLKHLKRKHRMDLYPANEEESLRSVGGTTKNSDKPKKTNKVKRVTTITNTAEVEPEPSIQHGPLVFTESCVRMRWTDHSDAFLGTFSRLYADESYTDVTLVAEKIFFKAHRVVLSAASDFFDEMFKMTPAGQHPIIFLKDIKAMELRLLIDFIYKGEVAIPPSVINELVRIGTDMKVRGLCDFQWNDSMKSSVFNIHQNGNIVQQQSNPTVRTNHEILGNQGQTSPVVSSAHSATMPSYSPLYNTLSPTPTITPLAATMASKLVTSTRGLIKQAVDIAKPPMVTKTLNYQPNSSSVQPTFARILTNVRPGNNPITPNVSHVLPTVTSIGSCGLPALKRFRILTSSAASNKVGIGTTRFDLGTPNTGVTNQMGTNGLSSDSGAVLMVSNEGENVLSTAPGEVSVIPQDTLSSVKTDQMDSHNQHLGSHPITLVSHHLGDSTEDLDEVVYSITSVTGPHGEVLMSEPVEGEGSETETIVVYGSGDDVHHSATCESNKKLL